MKPSRRNRSSSAGQADRLIVGRWLGAPTLGLYSLACQFVTAPAFLVGQVLDRVLFATMARVQHTMQLEAQGGRPAQDVGRVRLGREHDDGHRSTVLGLAQGAEHVPGVRRDPPAGSGLSEARLGRALRGAVV